MKTSSLLGCGYLGFPLALNLLQMGYNVKGSTTTPEKIKQLKKVGIIPYLIRVDKDMNKDFFDADVLVLTLPFKKTFKDPNIYKNQIKVVCDSVLMSPIQHIVFTSSSSVYPKDSNIYLPDDNFLPTNLRAEVLLQCEEILNKLENVSVVTIRLGGIYSDERSIKKSIKPRRLVSQNDAIEYIINGINKLGSNDCINGFKSIVI